MRQIRRSGKSRSAILLADALIVLNSAALFQPLSYSVTSKESAQDGLVFTMSNNAKMKVQICSGRIIRVVYTLKDKIPEASDNHIVFKGQWDVPVWNSKESESAYVISTDDLIVEISKENGTVAFLTASGKPILRETDGKTLTEKKVEGYTAYEGTIKFDQTDPDEGIYGFGNLQNTPRYLPFNLRGQSILLVQLNEVDCTPFFISTRGFGVLWINYSKMSVNSPLTLWSNWATNDAIDYYFIYGPQFDTIIAGYRKITGPAPLWPKWAYGFWQCKNKYESQSQILGIVEQYRRKGYPIDNIVQDWMYYPSGGNGCQCWDISRYPDPKGMIKKLHDSLNCHFTISVWPSFNPASGENYNFMSSRGYLLNSQDFLGTTYDAFNDSASYYYWKFIDDSLVSKGVDAFWPDATEPEYHQNWETATTCVGPAVKVENLFPLLHSRTLYEGFRSSQFAKGKRVCNLTRSYYAGSQRYSAAYWTGDVNVDFPTYIVQIPAGLNVCMSGLPLFCTDIGGFWGETPSDLMIRWFQFGTFNPVFRVHGTRNENELWSWGGATEEILLKYSRLRYRLFPYVYSLAWKVTNEGYTIMRGLPFDFMDDLNVRNRDDEFMFGPALLVCPVTSEANATTKSVYLPEGVWYDFWTGKKTNGRQTITADAPLDKIPLFVRAGSILPMGPEITYADTPANPIELRVYTGADGEFVLYEDRGDGYEYEKGEYATIPFRWSESSQELAIGHTSGSFPGMLESRIFNVVWVSENHGTGGGVTASVDKEINYNGNKLILNKTTGEIGVVNRFGRPKTLLVKERLAGKRFLVFAEGEGTLEVRLIDVKGCLAAKRRVKGGTSQVITEHLAGGVYFVEYNYNNSVKSGKSLIVP